jgi:proteic killer suppression protein
MRGDSLEIEYSNRSIEKVCTNASVAVKKHGQEMANKIHQRIDEIHAADTVEEMVQFKIGRCHHLHQNRKSQYAVDLVHPYRLVFEKEGNEIQVVNIIEIVDYH